MSMKDKIIFFALGFHHGKINQVLHIIGIAIMLYAIYRQNLMLVALSLVTMEYGHWYQYRHSSDDYKAQVREILTIQIVLIFFVVGTLSVIFHHYSW